MSEVLAAARSRREAVEYYTVLVLWPLYLFLLPAVFAKASGWWTAAYLFIPGVYLFTWAGFLMHESWHGYVPTINNRFFYNAFSLLILTDPQLYHLLHGSHHGQIHTYMDAEFHPLGEIRSRKRRIVYNLLEFIFGVAFLVAVASWSIPRDSRFAGKYRLWRLIAALCGWAAIFGALGYLSHGVFGVTAGEVLVSYALTFWVGSFVLHQSQLIEHGNLIVEGPIGVRNLMSRNLKPAGVAEKAFLLLTHNEAREHVLHHTRANVNSRPFPGTHPMPQGAVTITLAEYLPLAWRMLKGEADRVVIGDSASARLAGTFSAAPK